MDPSGGTDMTENLEKVVSLRSTTGRSGASSNVCTGGWTLIVVGSVSPLSVMAGGAIAGMLEVMAVNQARLETARPGRRKPKGKVNRKTPYTVSLWHDPAPSSRRRVVYDAGLELVLLAVAERWRHDCGGTQCCVMSQWHSLRDLFLHCTRCPHGKHGRQLTATNNGLERSNQVPLRTTSSCQLRSQLCKRPGDQETACSASCHFTAVEKHGLSHKL